MLRRREISHLKKGVSFRASVSAAFAWNKSNYVEREQDAKLRRPRVARPPHGEICRGLFQILFNHNMSVVVAERCLDNARTCSVLLQHLWRAARHDNGVGRRLRAPSSGRACHFDRSERKRTERRNLHGYVSDTLLPHYASPSIWGGFCLKEQEDGEGDILKFYPHCHPERQRRISLSDYSTAHT